MLSAIRTKEVIFWPLIWLSTLLLDSRKRIQGIKLCFVLDFPNDFEIIQTSSFNLC